MIRFIFLFFVLFTPLFSFDLKIKDLETLILNEKIDALHVIKHVTDTGLILTDDSEWKMGWYYRGVLKEWKQGDRLKISYHSGYSNVIKFENLDASNTSWGNLEKKPSPHLGDYLASLFNPKIDPEGKTKIILHSGLCFKGENISWKIRDAIFVLESEKENHFDLWNLTRNEIVPGWLIIDKEDSQNLEEKLAKSVLGQTEAIQTVTTAIFNYWAGLNDPKTPIGVFLFLGPTGVGKTELAKVLTNELFKSQKFLIRFDMSHFNEPHSTSRLIGSPPGYVNHEEGGQLTEALKAKPKSVVLLDEIEKAHPVVRKLFLPVFDEGYIADAKNRKVFCNNAVFIMTSNICAHEIANFFNSGMDSQTVLEMIEPALIQNLSPELYNRIIPVVFRPLSEDLMLSLVDKMLKEVIARLKEVKNITLVVDESACKYLALHGYHPTMGARPLKRLIQKKVVGTLATEIVYKSIPDGSHVTLHYDDDHWFVTWF